MTPTPDLLKEPPPLPPARGGGRSRGRSRRSTRRAGPPPRSPRRRPARALRRRRSPPISPALFGGVLSTANLLGRVGTASRCLQLSRNRSPRRRSAIAARPPLLPVEDYAPPWISHAGSGLVSERDPGRDLLRVVWSIYAQGDAFLWTTSSATPPAIRRRGPSSIRSRRWSTPRNGSRTYTYDGSRSSPATSSRSSGTRPARSAGRARSRLTPRTSSPRSRETTTPARVLGGGGVPPAVIKSARRLTADQAADVKLQWINRVGGLSEPAILPPDLDFEQLAFSPKDLTLLETRE